jgi:hypothetical protein
MDELYLHTLGNMEATLANLTNRVPKPQRVPMCDSFAFRYVEKSIHQAIIQKLARVISTLHSARILLEYGFIQEQSALQRMLDEFLEDITFLSYALIANEVTELHRSYLNYFYEEEFDIPEDAIKSTQKRPMVPRQKIHAYLSKLEGSGLDQNLGVEVRRTISKAYSGYVHGASPHIMEMFGGNPPKFHVAGMIGTPFFNTHQHDLENYFYRGICVFAIAVRAFGDDALFLSIKYYCDEFGQQIGQAE